MPVPVETKLDFDRTVSTEDRFAIRKAMDRFVAAVNKCEADVYQEMVSDGALIKGFSDIPQVKQGFITMLQRRFKGDGVNFMRFPELKLNFNKFVYHLKGTYEEFKDSILVTEGTIEIAMIKCEDKFEFARVVFYPRMILRDGDDGII